MVAGLGLEKSESSEGEGMTPARELGNIALFTQRVIAHGGELEN